MGSFMPLEESSPKPEKSIEGQKLLPTTPEQLNQAIEWAFDYRGDVTVELITGEKVEGYVFDRNVHLPHPCMKLFLRGQSHIRIIAYKEVRAMIFSGEDTAFGKSWDEWVKKSQKSSSR